MHLAKSKSKGAILKPSQTFFEVQRTWVRIPSLSKNSYSGFQKYTGGTILSAAVQKCHSQCNVTSCVVLEWSKKCQFATLVSIWLNLKWGEKKIFEKFILIYLLHRFKLLRATRASSDFHNWLFWAKFDLHPDLIFLPFISFIEITALVGSRIYPYLDVAASQMFSHSVADITSRAIYFIGTLGVVTFACTYLHTFGHETLNLSFATFSKSAQLIFIPCSS